MSLKLRAGHFYKSKAGDVWCCYRFAPSIGHSRTMCIEVSSISRVEYFYPDGRYDSEGKRETCLVEECGPNGEPLATDVVDANFAVLNVICDEALRIAVEHGFTDATIGEDVALMHTELSEFFEDYRGGRVLTAMHYVEKVDVCDRSGYPIEDDEGKPVKVEVVRKNPRNTDGSLRKPCGPPSEAADVFVRLAHFCGKHKIDLARAVREKMAYNESRPFKHGGKVV